MEQPMARTLEYRRAFIVGAVTIDACWAANDPLVGGAEAFFDLTLPIPSDQPGAFTQAEVAAQAAEATTIALAWAQERATEHGILDR